MSRTLGFAVLGLLAKQPRTGYQISRAMERPVGYFWSAQHSQIYSELADLESEGLVAATVIAGPGPRPTKRYEITAEGTSELVEWLRGPVPPASQKNELVLRVWSMWLMSPDDARALVQRVRSDQQAALDAYAGGDADSTGSAGEPAEVTSPAFGEYATLQFGVLRGRATIDWCDWLLSRLPTEET